VHTASVAERSSGQRGKTLHALRFGGEMCNATVCSSCGQSSSRTDAFSEVPLTFPNTFTPIEDVAVVVGTSPDVAAPDGFERICVNLNSGRTGAPYTYLCIRRAESWEVTKSPVTDITVVNDALAHNAALPSPPRGFELIPTDVNKGGTRRVYVAVRRLSGGSPITALEVIANATSAVTPQVPSAGFTKLADDLNMVRGVAAVLALESDCGVVSTHSCDPRSLYAVLCCCADDAR
jgi:hypothetical protein